MYINKTLKYVLPHLRQERVSLPFNFKLKNDPLNKLKQNQQIKLSNINIMLNNSSLPDNIKELQKILFFLLNNVYINEYGIDNQSSESFKIAEVTDENIYRIPENQENLDIEKYKEFLKFMIRKLHKNNKEYVNNNGEILTAHYVDGATEEDKTEMEKIRHKYDLNFIGGLSLIDHKLNKSKNPYPIFYEDLLKKTRDKPYEEGETELNITPIQNQTSEEFIGTIDKRILGLEKCKEEDTDRSEYYSYELDRENKKI